MDDPLEQTADVGNVNKYKKAGLIAVQVLNEIVSQIIVGKNIGELCKYGNELILKKVGSEGGIAFPVCISIGREAGNCVSNYVLKDRDLAKVELAVHIGGFPAVVGFTVVVGDGTELEDKKKKVIRGVIEASREIFEIMTPGRTNFDIKKILEKKAKEYDCSLPICNENGIVPGIFSYQISKGVLNGYNEDEDQYPHNSILCRDNPNYDFSMRESEFEEGEVYAIDVMMTTGSGRLNAIGIPTQIFKRSWEVREQLKLKSSKSSLALFGAEKFPKFIEGDNRIKLGLKECLSKKLLEPYPIVGEKEGEHIARIKFTVLVEKKPLLICGKPANQELVKSLK